MSDPDTPVAQGGSYIKHPDGRLERIEHTAPAEAAPAAHDAVAAETAAKEAGNA